MEIGLGVCRGCPEIRDEVEMLRLSHQVDTLQQMSDRMSCAPFCNQSLQPF